MNDFVRETLGPPGYLLSYSKSAYQKSVPTHLVVFNGNVFADNEKIWHGDIDVTLSESRLKRLAKLLQKKIYVLREMDGRFENESRPKLDRAAFWVDKDGNFYVETVVVCG